MDGFVTAIKKHPGAVQLCRSDAIDDPDHRGFWTTLALWNRWRHNTYADNPDGETPYLDPLPAAETGRVERVVAAEKKPPAVKDHFTVVSTEEHTVGGNGRMAGKKQVKTWYGCKKEGCSRGACKPIPELGAATGQLFRHLGQCQPDLCQNLRVESKHSPVEIDADGNEYVLFSFEELLPHHVRYVQKCFRGFDHFYETRADNGLKEYLQGYQKRAALPEERTCQQLLQVMDELVDEKVMLLIQRHKDALGSPCAGSTTDIWSLGSCRESFGCMRGAFVMDGDMVAEVTGDITYKGKLVDMAPLLAFSRFAASHHTGAVIATWKGDVLKAWKLTGGIGLATEDGASPNKKANKILKQDMKVCYPHDIARAVLLAAGEDGKPCRNPEMKALSSRSSKQAASFHRSVVASKALEQAQLDEDPNLHTSQALTTKTKNKTRWLGLSAMYNRNRLLGPEIRVALTGDANGECAETPAAPLDKDSSEDDGDDSDDDGSESEGEAQEAAARVKNKQWPLAHRCISLEDYRDTDVAESLLDRPRETTLLVQTESEHAGEGLDLGLSWLAVKAMHDEATHDRVELISGRKETELWKEANANGLKPMFKTFRKEFAKELTQRFDLNTTPDDHILLALMMNPSINTSLASSLMVGKSAMYEMAMAVYKRALRRQALRHRELKSPTVPEQATPAAVPAAPEQETATTTETYVTPAPKRRKSLLGSVATQMKTEDAEDADQSAIDVQVQAEIESFAIISQNIIAAGDKSEYFDAKGSRLNLRTFWAAHKAVLPLHFSLYLAEVGCKKSAAANVESVFSGAGKFTDEAKSSGDSLISRMVKLHYNWKYVFLRPTEKEIIDRYDSKFRPTVYTKRAASAAASTASSSSAAASAASSSAAP